MNFSFLGISIKSPNDLFSWHRIKSTLLLNWYVFWRLALIYLSVIVLVIGLVILDDSEQTIDNVDLYMEHPWYNHISTLLITLISSIFTNNSLYRKNYHSFILDLNYISKPQFWSGYFWKRYILLTIVMELFIHLLEKNIPNESILFAGIILYAAEMSISHLCLHSGFWGVKYELKHLNKHKDRITN